MKRIALALFLLATPALAQQQPQPSPAEQALGQDLMQAVQEKVSIRARLIDTERQLSAAQAKIKELEAAAAKPANQ